MYDLAKVDFLHFYLCKKSVHSLPEAEVTK